MDMDKSRIKSLQSLAEIFLKEDKKVYIKDINGDYYFADIIFVGEESLTIQCFAPSHREGKKFTLYWVSIERFDAYKGEM